MKKILSMNPIHRIVFRVAKSVIAIITGSVILIALPGEVVRVDAASAARNTVVAHMRLMATRKWIPSKTWFNYAKAGRIDDYIKGNVYYGMPYSQNNDRSYANKILEEWHHFNSKLTKLPYPYPDIYSCEVTVGLEIAKWDEFGNDCVKAIFQSWKQAGSKTPISGINTANMLSAVISPSNSMKKVGDYLAKPGDDTLVMTPVITSSSSQAKRNQYNMVMQAYMFLQPVDALVQRYPGKGHAIMVVSVNPTACVLGTIEQIGSGSASGSKSAGWRLDNTFSTWIVGAYTYKSLYKSHYVPLTTDFSGW